MTNGQRLRAFIAAKMKPAVMFDRFGTAYPVQNDNYKQAFMPMLWIKSSIQTAGETEKRVGFPLMRSARRQELKALRFDQDIANPDTRAAVAYHVWSATLQPVSTFFNRPARTTELRAPCRRTIGAVRTELYQRCGVQPACSHRAAEHLPNLLQLVRTSAIRGALARGRWRGRSAVGPDTEAGFRTDRVVPMTRRQVKVPVLRTPAMRLGLQEVKHDKNGHLIVPSLHRVLYRPWFYWGTPVWDKFENRRVDRRSLRYANRQRDTNLKRSGKGAGAVRIVESNCARRSPMAAGDTRA